MEWEALSGDGSRNTAGDVSAFCGAASDRFRARFVEALPGESSFHQQSRQVPEVCYSRVRPTPVRQPALLAWSDRVGELLHLMPPGSHGPSLNALAGNALLPGMVPYAARYGGHQFGHWAGQLGDGRAITLGELVGAAGDAWELQLKGAGRTPYSRSADGRAVLRSSVREFLCSEAMHHLGVPTTRALSLVATGDEVRRDMFYDGHPQDEPGAVVCRVAPSFVRFGNFQIHAAHDEHEALLRLTDFVMTQHYPEFAKIQDPVARVAQWFDEVARRTAVMVAHWTRVGFVHGVMNTDNMSILGLTIDYGPYGWLEGYDPGWTPNTTDAEGRRYCFGQQPRIAQWNLARLAEALLPMVPDESLLAAGLEQYRRSFESVSRQMMADKLGLRSLTDETLVSDLFELLQSEETDMTIFFRRLAEVPVKEEADDLALLNPLMPAFYSEISEAHARKLAAWLRRHGQQVRAEFDEAAMPGRHANMQRTNPKYVPRNYLAQLAIDDLMAGRDVMLKRLMTVFEHPYDEQPEHEDLAVRRPEWARHKAGCSALSCSS